MNRMPALVVFACNWDGLSCIEAAAQSGLTYPPSVQLVKVSCLSRIQQGFILKAFEFGADGVVLLGCDPKSCEFGTDQALLDRECEKARTVMTMLGIDEGRLIRCHLGRGDGQAFVRLVKDFMHDIEKGLSGKAGKLRH
ncbi:MAG: hydrogenase iron-sulfur subunit [Dehalococcoidia bacterium]|nr:hydrogenase iron-sulfur subunit [Dehalococcoidia bacterium]